MEEFKYPIKGSYNLRKGRWSIPENFYFITTSTYARKPIFLQSEIAQIIFDSIEWLQKMKRLEWVCIQIMPDHIHMVIKLGQEESLSKLINSFKGFTGKKITEFQHSHCSIWQNQYYDHCIRREENLNEIILYCYENPLRKGLVESSKDYPYWRCKFDIE